MPKKGRRSSRSNTTTTTPKSEESKTKRKRSTTQEDVDEHEEEGPVRKVKKVTLKFSGKKETFTPIDEQENETKENGNSKEIDDDEEEQQQQQQPGHNTRSTRRTPKKTNNNSKKDGDANSSTSSSSSSSSSTRSDSVLSTDLIHIIQKLYDEDEQAIFHSPVSEEEVPGYSTIIKHPMDLSTLKANLCQLKYKTVESFKHDMNLVFKNAMTFNPVDSIYHKEAARLKKLANTLTKNFDDQAKIIEPEDLGTAEPDVSLSALKKSFNSVIEELKKLDTQGIFYEPVPSNIPSYYSLIERPLDFQTLKKKVNAGRIKNWEDFRANLLIIFNNATKFNQPSTVFHKQAKQMIKKVDTLVKSTKSATSPKATKQTEKKIEKQDEKKTVKQPEIKNEEVVAKEELETPKRRSTRTSTPRKASVSVEPSTPVPTETVSNEKTEELKENLKEEADEATPKQSSSKKNVASSAKRKSNQRPPPAPELELPKLERDTMAQLQQAFLNKLKEADIYKIFLNPVSGISGYADVIDKPMDFSTMETKVTKGEYEGEWKPFEDDCELVFSNAKRFNVSSSVYFKEANRLLRMFRKWKKDLYHILVDQDPVDNSKVLENFEKIAHFKQRKVEQAFLDEVAGMGDDASEPEPEPEPEKEKRRTRRDDKQATPVTPKPAPKGGARPMSEIISELIDELIQEDKKELFLQPPKISAESEESPLDFTSMKNRKYKKLNVFEEDFKLLCDHAMSVNDSKSEISKEAQRLLRYGEKRIEEIRKRLVKPIEDESKAGKPIRQTQTRSASTRKERLDNRDTSIQSQKLQKLNREQINKYKNIVKATNILYRMQKRDMSQAYKDYCALSEMEFIPDEMLNPPFCEPGDFPLYEFAGPRPPPTPFPVVPTNMPAVAAAMMSPSVPFPSTPSTPSALPIMSQLFQGVPGTPVTPGPSPFPVPQTPSTPVMMHTQTPKPTTPLTPHVQSFALPQARIVSYKPVRVVPKIPMVVKRYTEGVRQITDDEYDSVKNASIEDCLRLPNLFQSVLYKDYSSRREQMKPDQPDEFSVQKLLDSRRKVSGDMTLLNLLNGSGAAAPQSAQIPATPTRATVSVTSIDDRFLAQVVEFARSADADGDVIMSDAEQALIKDLISVDDANSISDPELQEMFDRVTQTMTEEGLEDFGVTSLSQQAEQQQNGAVHSD